MTEQSTSQIRLLCRLIRYGAVAFIVLRVALHVALWAMPELEPLGLSMPFSVPGLDWDQLHSLSGGTRFIAALIAVPYLAMLAYAVLCLLAMLRAFERAAFFDITTVQRLRGFAGALLIARVLVVPTIYARSYVVARLSGEADAHGILTFVPDDLAVLLICGVFYLIARIMEEGRRLADENRGFV